MCKKNKVLNDLDFSENVHLNAIIEGTIHSIWAFDREYKILYINKVFQNSYLNSFGVLLTKGSCLLDALPDPLKSIWKQRYDRVLAKEYLRFEDAVETPTGTIYIDVVFNPIIHNGEVVGGSCFGSDITISKRIENQLIDNNEFVKTLLNAIPVGIFFKDKEGKYLGCNNIFTELTGKDTIEIIGKTVYDVWPSEIATKFQEKDNEIIISGVSQNYESQIFDKDGNLKSVVIAKDIYKDINGQTMGIVGAFLDISERKKAEEALKQSEKNYHEISTLLRLMADNMPDLLWAKNLKKEFIFTNKAICDVLLHAHDTEEPIGKTDLFFAERERAANPKDPNWHTFGEICRDSDSVTIENLTPSQFDEFGNVRGKFLFLDVYKAPLYDEKGELIGVVGSGRDVTEQKEAHNKLAITKDTFQNIFNSITEAIYILNTSGVFIDVNYGAQKMYGYSKEELIGKTPYDVSAEGFNDMDTVIKVMNQVVENGSPQSFEFWGVRKNGEIFPKDVIVNKGTYFGNPCIIATARDISERKRNETIQKIQYKVAKYLQKAKNIEDLLQTIDAEIKLLAPYSNFCVAKFDEQNGELFPIFCDTIDKEIFNWNLNQLLANNIIKSNSAIFFSQKEITDFIEFNKIENVIISPKSWMGVPIILNNKPIGVMVLQNFYDPNAFKLSYLTLLEMIAYDTSTFMERELILQDVIAAKEKAEQSAKLKTAFMQNLSHEIRTPLNGIIGFSGLLKENNIQAEDAQKFSEIIIERGWQLTSIINDILTISSLETQQEQLFNESFNVNELLKNQIAVFSEQAKFKGVQLVINKLLSEEESQIYTDKNKLGQILNNLFTNAFKFTQQGEIELGCTLNGNMLQFFVRDTGIGIEKSKQELVFERFAQADDLIRRDYGGTGLGLSICKGFVELMGGKIWIESEPNQGSTFHFMIPFHKNIINNVTKNMEQEMNGTDKMITVLVAEDDEINFSYLNIVLKKLNVNVIRAENGQEAVDFCKTELIDIILMDIKMPVMNGYTAAKLIKEFKPNLPIIAQSAHAVQAEIEEYRDAFDDYITKPIKIFDFKEILQKYIK